MFAAIIAAACVAVLPVLADPVPSAPGPNDVFQVGSTCPIEWTADTTGVWKVMNIELMTGDNFNMVHLSTVATLDGTDATKTTFSYPCLAVTPNSAIYFYQFSSPASPNKTWTTRFAIADEKGATTPPPNAVQPGGAAIPWGTGKLIDPSQGTPAPGGSNTTTNATTTPTGTGAPLSPPPAAPTNSSTSVSSTTPTTSPVSTTASSTSSSATSTPTGSNNTGGAASRTFSAVAALFGVAVFVTLL